MNGAPDLAVFACGKYTVSAGPLMRPFYRALPCVRHCGRDLPRHCGPRPAISSPRCRVAARHDVQWFLLDVQFICAAAPAYACVKRTLPAQTICRSDHGRPRVLYVPGWKSLLFNPAGAKFGGAGLRMALFNPAGAKFGVAGWRMALFNPADWLCGGKQSEVWDFRMKFIIFANQ